MRYAFYTLSGARYMINLEEMTWQRDGTASNQDVVVGADHFLGNDGKSGKLFAKPNIEVGRRAEIQIGPEKHDYILCTRIERIEMLDEGPHGLMHSVAGLKNCPECLEWLRQNRGTPPA